MAMVQENFAVVPMTFPLDPTTCNNRSE